MDQNGIQLEVLIRAADAQYGIKFGGVSYPLLKVGDQEKLQICYHLYLQTPSPDLQKALKVIIEKHAGVLSQSLQNIIAK